MNIRTVSRWSLWVLGLVAAAKRIWTLVFPPAAMTRSQRKQLRKKMVEEEQQSRRENIRSPQGPTSP